jgi:amino acid permease
VNHDKKVLWTRIMQTILIILAVIYLAVGFVIYLMTMQKSDALQNTIANHSPLNTYGYTHKWLWLLIVCLWPVWLLMQEKLPDEGRKGPF